MKLIIDIPEETKRAFDKAESNDLKGGYYDHGGVIGKAIQNGIPLDSNSEKAEVQAYFDGQAYGWEEGRKDLCDKISAEIKELTKAHCIQVMDREDIPLLALDIIEKYKGDSE